MSLFQDGAKGFNTMLDHYEKHKDDEGYVVWAYFSVRTELGIWTSLYIAQQFESPVDRSKYESIARLEAIKAYYEAYPKSNIAELHLLVMLTAFNPPEQKTKKRKTK